MRRVKVRRQRQDHQQAPRSHRTRASHRRHRINRHGAHSVSRLTAEQSEEPGLAEEIQGAAEDVQEKLEHPSVEDNALAEAGKNVSGLVASVAQGVTAARGLSGSSGFERAQNALDAVSALHGAGSAATDLIRGAAGVEGDEGAVAGREAASSTLDALSTTFEGVSTLKDPESSKTKKAKAFLGMLTAGTQAVGAVGESIANPAATEEGQTIFHAIGEGAEQAGGTLTDIADFASNAREGFKPLKKGKRFRALQALGRAGTSSAKAVKKAAQFAKTAGAGEAAGEVASVAGQVAGGLSAGAGALQVGREIHKLKKASNAKNDIQKSLIMTDVARAFAGNNHRVSESLREESEAREFLAESLTTRQKEAFVAGSQGVLKVGAGAATAAGPAGAAAAVALGTASAVVGGANKAGKHLTQNRRDAKLKEQKALLTRKAANKLTRGKIKFTKKQEKLLESQQEIKRIRRRANRGQKLTINQRLKLSTRSVNEDAARERQIERKAITAGALLQDRTERARLELMRAAGIKPDDFDKMRRDANGDPDVLRKKLESILPSI